MLSRLVLLCIVITFDTCFEAVEVNVVLAYRMRVGYDVLGSMLASMKSHPMLGCVETQACNVRVTRW